MVASIWVINLKLGDFITLVVSALLFFGVYGILLLTTKEPLVVELIEQVVVKTAKKIEHLE